MDNRIFIPFFLLGPCQFPTLGFVVSRYEQVKSFVPEQFWYIHLSLTSHPPGEGEIVTDFNWKRNRLFDFATASTLYELVLENPEARVTSVIKKNVKNWYAVTIRGVCAASKSSSDAGNRTPLLLLSFRKPPLESYGSPRRKCSTYGPRRLYLRPGSFRIHIDRRKSVSEGVPILSKN
jgi:hypothetical protein